MSLTVEYLRELRLWYKAMRLSVRTGCDDEFGLWLPDVIEELKPGPDERFGTWWRSRVDLFEPAKEFPIVVHQTREAAAAHWIVGDPTKPLEEDTVVPEIHLTLCLYYSRKEIEDAVHELLEPHGKRGPITKRRQTADAQPNAPISLKQLQEVKEALQLWCSELDRQPMAADEVASTFGLRRLDDGSMDDTVDRWARRRRELAKSLMRGVRQGRFPDESRKPNSDPDPDWRRAIIW